MRCVGCLKASDRVFCNSACFDLFLKKGNEAKQFKSMPAPCRLCPFRRGADWHPSHETGILQVHLKHAVQALCHTAAQHCGMNRQCYGYKLAMAGGNSNVYSREEFLDRVWDDSRPFNPVVYLKKFFGSVPKFTLELKGRIVVWADGPNQGDPAKNRDGVPFLGNPEASILSKESFLTEINQTIERVNQSQLTGLIGAKS